MDKAETKTYQPFSNGSEFVCWSARNCDQCNKGYDEKSKSKIGGVRGFKCDLEHAIGLAYMESGGITKEFYDRFNPDICPEKT